MIISTNIKTGVVWNVFWCGWPRLRSPLWRYNVKNFFWRIDHKEVGHGVRVSSYSICGLLWVVVRAK